MLYVTFVAQHLRQRQCSQQHMAVTLGSIAAALLGLSNTKGQVGMLI
jgi:hypothetical protein